MKKLIRLEDFARIGTGNSAPQDKNLFKGGIFPFVRTSDVGAIHVGSIGTTRDCLTSEGIKGLKLHPIGTILFPKSGASTYLNHRVILSQPAYVSSHLATIKVKNDLAHDKFLFYFLQTIDARDLCQDQSYPSLNREQIASILLALPSLARQREIVEKLDSVFSEIEVLREKCSKQISCTTEILNQYLGLLLGDSEANWITQPLSGWCELIGTGPFGSAVHKADYTVEGIPLVNPSNIGNGIIIHDAIKRVSTQKANELVSYRIREGDLVLGRRGEMGRVAVVSSEEDGWICGTGSFFLRPTSECDSQLLCHVLGSQKSRAELEKISTGVTMSNLNNRAVGSMLVSLPPKEIQADVRHKMRDFETCANEQIRAYEQKIELFMELKSAALAASFSEVA